MGPSRTTVVLNVDDDSAARYAITRSLEAELFTVIEAADGKEALEKAVLHSPDVVLLNIYLPDVHGFELCRRIRHHPHLSDVVIIHRSASFVEVSSQVAESEDCADGYLTGPVEPAVLLATMRSLLRLRTALRGIRDAATDWQATFDCIGDGLAVVGMDGRIRRANRSMGAIFGHTAAELEGKLLRDLLPPVQGRFSMMERMIERGSRETEEHARGDRIIAASVDPMPGSDEGLRGGVCTVSDITERRRMERELQQAQKLDSIGILAGGVAHDFNNLLTAILGNASLVADNLSPDDPNMELVQQILLGSQSAARLTQSLLTYAGKGFVAMRPVDVSQVILESHPLLRAFIPKTVTLKLELTNSAQIVADAGQIQQAVMNLVINAVESISGEGRVVVRTGLQEISREFLRARAPESNVEPGRYALIEVEDTGEGISHEIVSKIFDPFFTTRFMGRGLGLAVVDGTVRSHKGLHIVESAQGKGSCFRLLFPAISLPVPRTSDRPAKAGATPFARVLVIDDEMFVRQTALASLERHGFEVLLAESGQQALEILKQRRGHIDAIVLDLSMPSMDGKETLEFVRKIDPEIPVLLSSGFSEEAAMERFAGKGLAGFVQKPYTASKLADAVKIAISTGNLKN